MRSLRGDGGVTEEEIVEVVPRGWRDRAFRPEEVSASGDSDSDVLATCNPETINSHNTQKKLGNQVSRMCYDRYVTSLDGLPIHARPLEDIGPFGESEARECTKTRQRSQSEPGAAAWLQARPVDASRIILRAPA